MGLSRCSGLPGKSSGLTWKKQQHTDPEIPTHPGDTAPGILEVPYKGPGWGGAWACSP